MIFQRMPVFVSHILYSFFSFSPLAPPPGVKNKDNLEERIRIEIWYKNNSLCDDLLQPQRVVVRKKREHPFTA